MTIVGMREAVPAGAVVVVIDVIRAFTTAAVAFERGAAGIVCTASPDSGRRMRRLHPDRLLIGEIGGLKPADFDIGNSPAEMSTAPVDGRHLIQTTSNGTRGLLRDSRPAALLAASARNVAATARWIAAHHAGTPWTVVCTGRTPEDRACAVHLDHLLRGGTPDRTALVNDIVAAAAQQAEASTRKPADERVDLTADLPFCSDIDRSDFAMVGRRNDDHVALTPVPC